MKTRKWLKGDFISLDLIMLVDTCFALVVFSPKTLLNCTKKTQWLTKEMIYSVELKYYNCVTERTTVRSSLRQHVHNTCILSIQMRHFV